MAYAVQADLEERFGTSNIDTWATLTSGDSAATKTARIAEAIAVAADELDEVLRCTPGFESKLPISTVPSSVTDKVAIRAGLWLYGFRATEDYPQNYIEHLEKRLDLWLAEVRSGQRKLDIP